MKRLSKEQKAELLAERRRRNQKPFTIDDFAGGDTPQRKYLLSIAPFTIALCSKRAGKSFGNMFLLASVALATPGVTSLYIGLTMASVKYQIVNKLWDRIVHKYDLPFTPVNSDGVSTCTLNGSIVRFASSDDQAHIESFMGDTLAGGIVIIDECQSMSLNVLQPLVETIIVPSLWDTTEERPVAGRLVLSGTIPTTPHGYFYSKWVESNDWDKHTWNRFQNKFLIRQEEALGKVLTSLNTTREDPMIRRLWYGELIFDANENAYRYTSAKATYMPASLDKRDVGPFHCLFAPTVGLDRFAFGLDPAQRRDRFAFVGWGWNAKRRDGLWQIAEAVTDPAADPFESEWLAVVLEMKRLFAGGRYIRDPGSTASVNDVLYHTHGILIENAIKGPGSLKARVDRLADLLKCGQAKVIEGSMLDKDLITAKWDVAALDKGKWEFDKSVCSPDVSDAGSYAVVAYTEIGGEKAKPKDVPEDVWWKAEAAKELERRYRDWKPDKAPKASKLAWMVPPS